MRVLVLSLLCVAALAAINPSKAPSSAAPAGTYVDPKTIPNSQRAPCPVLNTLANHGHIDRTGQSVTFGDLTKAMVNVLGFSDSFANLFVKTAFKNFLPPNTPPTDTSKWHVSLGNLTLSNDLGGVEHVSSMARLDNVVVTKVAGPPNTAQIDAIFKAADAAVKTKPSDPDEISMDLMAQIRIAAEAISAKEKTVTVSPVHMLKHRATAMGESCLLLHVSTPSGAKSPRRSVFLSVLKNERLPDGYKKPDGAAGLLEVGGCVAHLGLEKIDDNLSAYFDTKVDAIKSELTSGFNKAWDALKKAGQGAEQKVKDLVNKLKHL